MPTSRSDWTLVRQAVNHNWAVSPAVRDAVLADLFDDMIGCLDGRESRDAGRGIHLARIVVAMEAANIRSERKQSRAWKTEHPRAELSHDEPDTI